MHRNRNIKPSLRPGLSLPFTFRSPSTYRPVSCAIYRVQSLQVLRLYTSRCLRRQAGGYHITIRPGMHLSFPPLPPKPSYPPPLIGEEAMNSYVIPLYLRSWGIYPKAATKGSTHHTWPGLTRIYNMKDITTAREFFKDIVEICKKEQHDLQGLSITGSDLYVHSSTFILPNSVGITYSDIRLALLIESRFEERYAADLPRYQRPVWLPKSWSQFVGHRSIIYKHERPTSGVFPRPCFTPPIPPLPLDSTGRLHDDDISKYVQPMYDRRWFVFHRFRVFLVPQTAYEFKYRFTRLCKTFKLPSLEAQHRFTDKAMDLSINETGSVDVDMCSDRLVTVGCSTRMQPQGENHISIADVRLAILVETMFEESFPTSDSESTWRPPVLYRSTMPGTVAEIEREWKRYVQIMKERQIEKHNTRKEGLVMPLGFGKQILPE